MSETTQKIREEFGHYAERTGDGELLMLVNDADRLAAIDPQVLWRDESMPENAVGWFRGKANFPHWAIRFDTGYIEGVQLGPVAPDYRPDEPGPIWLPILDPPEGS